MLAKIFFSALIFDFLFQFIFRRKYLKRKGLLILMSPGVSGRRLILIKFFFLPASWDTNPPCYYQNAFPAWLPLAIFRDA